MYPIAGARQERYIQEEALAYERAAEFYSALGREEIGQTYMTKAHYCYTRWGATAKVEDLELEYPYLTSLRSHKESDRSTSTVTTTSTTGSRSGEFLDIATVLKASQAIFSALQLDKLLGQLIELAIENAGAQKGFLILSQGDRLTIEAAKELTGEVSLLQSLPLENAILPTAIVNYVARTQQEVVLSDATREGIFTNDVYVAEQKPRSILCSAIVNQGKLIGIIYLENNLTPGAFTPERLQVVKVISAQAANSIENAQLYRTLEAKVEERTAQLAQANQEITALNERLKADNLRMSAELEVTRKLQKMMLPKDEELQEIPGLEIAGFMEPADEVGGDYYDVLPYENGAKIGIGDVTGHGLESGMLMIMAQTAVRTLLESEESDPTRFLDILNRTICKNVQRMNSERNMTLALLDYQAGTFHLSGQHEEAIVVRSDGAIERIDTMDLGFPIGLDTEVAEYFAQMPLQLNPGDGIVLYTDGITEAPNLDKVQYGIERLCQIISENWQHSAEQIRQAVIDDLRNHIGMQKIYDDITLVVIKQK